MFARRRDISELLGRIEGLERSLDTRWDHHRRHEKMILNLRSDVSAIEERVGCTPIPVNDYSTVRLSAAIAGILDRLGLVYETTPEQIKLVPVPKKSKRSK